MRIKGQHFPHFLLYFAPYKSSKNLGGVPLLSSIILASGTFLSVNFVYDFKGEKNGAESEDKDKIKGF